ncbi:hypothetical protein AMAG_20416 [Allomyces macrogynus ATCC 38327]|uniref:Mitochondrial intermembrane space import and assembly protein 40 n=1 Tax=Allomyces macrogynus (strain ATCC 38327) TaxID=578462 RepID=A0A0L0T927_ALLM3|nr:hypothetical protein AMAG_20416 [Allomyces macrogynus ATCC 38327]|eukprot:KNE71221.1 hypothetical protein AMAG_20416 [Allomyces macrogynus ATCC 38327]
MPFGFGATTTHIEDDKDTVIFVEPVSQPDTSSSSSAGAVNDKGEINWDCPCLGGMAYGPCGPEFREAFSCFVHSEAEPKGVDCVEKFHAMQDCFKLHPDVYAEELKDENDEPVLEPTAGADHAAPVTAEVSEDEERTEVADPAAPVANAE